MVTNEAGGALLNPDIRRGHERRICMTYLQITLNVAPKNRSAAAEVYKKYRAPLPVGHSRRRVEETLDPERGCPGCVRLRHRRERERVPFQPTL
jgi:hypothetical protein